MATSEAAVNILTLDNAKLVSTYSPCGLKIDNYFCLPKRHQYLVKRVDNYKLKTFKFSSKAVVITRLAQ